MNVCFYFALHCDDADSNRAGWKKNKCVWMLSSSLFSFTFLWKKYTFDWSHTEANTLRSLPCPKCRLIIPPVLKYCIWEGCTDLNEIFLTYLVYLTYFIPVIQFIYLFIYLFICVSIILFSGFKRTERAQLYKQENNPTSKGKNNIQNVMKLVSGGKITP